MRFLLLFLVAACVDPVAGPPPIVIRPDADVVIEPACRLTTEVGPMRSVAHVVGVCNGMGHLRGGAATADNTTIAFVDRAVPCPFETTFDYNTPAPGTDWRYVVHLQDGRRPGISGCTGEHSDEVP